MEKEYILGSNPATLTTEELERLKVLEQERSRQAALEANSRRPPVTATSSSSSQSSVPIPSTPTAKKQPLTKQARRLEKLIQQAERETRRRYLEISSPDTALFVPSPDLKELRKATHMISDLFQSHSDIRDYISRSQRYLIDGDALLLLFASTSAGKPLNSLSIFYLIERYLADLKECGGDFNVVFFALNLFLYAKLDPAVFLLRLSLPIHLRTNTSITVFEITSWRDEDYQSWVRVWPPSFILTSIPCLSFRKITNFQAHVLAIDMLCSSLCCGMALADVGGVEFDDVTRLNVLECWDLQRPTIITKSLGKAIDAIPIPRRIDIMQILFQDQRIPSRWLLDELVKSHPQLQSLMDSPPSSSEQSHTTSWTSSAISISLRIGLWTEMINEHQVKLFLLHYIIQSHLGIYDRVQNTNLGQLPAADSDTNGTDWQSLIKVLIFVAQAIGRIHYELFRSMFFNVADVLDLQLYNSTIDHLRGLGTVDLGPPPSPPPEVSSDSADASPPSSETTKADSRIWIRLDDEAVLGFPDEMLAELHSSWNYINTPLPPLSADVATTAMPNPVPSQPKRRPFWPLFIELALPLERSVVSPSSSSLWPVRYRLADTVRSADGTKLPVLEQHHIESHTTALSANKVLEDNRHWRSGKIILAQDSVFIDEGKRGFHFMSGYISGLAATLSCEARTSLPPLMPPSLSLEHHSLKSSLIAKPTAQDERDIKRIEQRIHGLASQDRDRDETLVSSIEALRSVSTSTHETTISKMKHLIEMYRDLYKLLQANQSTTQLKRDETIARAIEVIFEIVHNYHKPPFWSGYSLKQLLDSVCDDIGVSDLKGLWKPPLPHPDEVASSSSPTESPSSSSKPPEESVESVGGSIRIQLRHMGPLMKRDSEGVRDSRISFLADPWQVKVLDGIDSRNCLLVTAPTSSGKSFISFYAMECELKTSKDSVVVFVAPTVALVNQVQAEVYQRFHLKYPHKGHISVFGSFTRDMRVAPTSCRVLVTVPACLEILLLSVPLQDTWVPKIRTIIFDEIHTISADESAVLARLLALAPCPFIALSATIGDVTRFGEYLSTIQARPVTLINHDKRHNDIEKYLIEPTFGKRKVQAASGQQPSSPSSSSSSPIPSNNSSAQNSSTKSIAVYEEKAIHANFMYCHPWAFALPYYFESSTPPASFSPKDSLVLYETVEELLHDGTFSSRMDVDLRNEMIEQLNPEIFFSGKLRLSQADTRAYERCLKDWFQRLIASNKVLARVVLMTLPPNLKGKKVSRFFPGQLKEHFAANIQLIVQQLKRTDKLPAIIFNFERAFCEDIADVLYQECVEREKRNTTSVEKKPPTARTPPSSPPPPAPNTQPRGAPSSKVATFTNNSFGVLETEEEEDDDNDRESSEPSPDQQLQDEPSIETDNSDVEENTFERLTEDDEIMPKHKLDQELSRLTAKLSAVKDGLSYVCMVDAIRYGIGVHHSGLKKLYKDAVERYFRMRQIKVVFATGTLAVGINMPCRSTVFMGDSVHLTPQQYRQMSGRSGRRGIDNLGHAFFWGIPVARIRHLELTQLDPIHSFFPLSISTTLRAAIVDHANSLLSPNVINRHPSVSETSKRLSNLYLRSLFIHQRPDQWVQVSIHTACAMEYLVDEGLMSLEGVPINLAGLVAHLSWTEPSNLIVAKFLTSPIARKLAIRWETTPNTVLEELVHFFASLFNRSNANFLRREGKPDTCEHEHIIVLPPLPTPLQSWLDSHRKKCLDIANRSILDFIRNHLDEGEVDSTDPHEHINTSAPRIRLRHETSLPLSGENSRLTFRSHLSHEQSKQTSNSESVTLMSLLLSTSLPMEMLSPFAGMAVARDRIESVSELRLLRQGLRLTNLALLPNQEDLFGQEEKANAYILDMYRCGNYDWLVEYNQMRPNDIRKNLQDFVLTLKTISNATRYFFQSDSDKLLIRMLDDLANSFQKRYEKLFNVVLDEQTVTKWGSDGSKQSSSSSSQSSVASPTVTSSSSSSPDSSIAIASSSSQGDEPHRPRKIQRDQKIAL